VRYDEPALRHLMGRVFNLLVRSRPAASRTPMRLSSFSAAAAHQLFGALGAVDWACDVELLYLARRRGYRIVEVPILAPPERQPRKPVARLAAHGGGRLAGAMERLARRVRARRYRPPDSSLTAAARQSQTPSCWPR
jgi:hypothetical protein